MKIATVFRKVPRRVASWGVLVPLGLLTGCNITRDLTVTDSSALSYDARVVKRLGQGPGGYGVEVDYAAVRGQQNETIDVGQMATLAGQSVTGPVEVRNDARVQTAHIAFNYLLFPSRPVEMEVVGGLAGLRMNWVAQPIASTQPRLSKRAEWYGITVGAGARWKIAEWVALEGRVTTNYSLLSGLFGGGDTLGYKTTGELGFAFKPAPQVVLRAGYARSVTYFDHSDFESRLTLKARGPSLGLGLVF